MSKQLDKVLNQPVNLLGLIDKIAFEPDTLEDAALEQPGLYLEASRYRTLKMRKAKRLELERDMKSAEVGLRLRRKSGDKLTVGAVKDAVTLDRGMVMAEEALVQAQVEEEYSKGLLEVFRQRLKVIEALKDIRVSEAAPMIRKVKNEMAAGHMRRLAEKARERFDKGDDEE